MLPARDRSRHLDRSARWAIHGDRAAGAGMTIVVLEDEAPARAWFEQVLARHRPGAEVVTISSVADAIAYLVAHPPPDLIIADIQLADGLSLEIFDHTQPGRPVIFATAYDEYVMRR